MDHLSVKTSETALHTGNAVALSYAIGDFGRCHHVIGHRTNSPGDLVSLQLGGEWDLDQVKSRLVDLTREHQAIWIDQFSIQQEPEEIRRQLQSVSSIHGTFDVIILLPDAPCTCLSARLAEFWQDQQKACNSEDVEDAVRKFDFFSLAGGCYGAVPISSYWQRLWTMQEFVYGRSIILCWSHQSPLPCLALSNSHEPLSESLQDYPNKSIKRLIRETKQIFQEYRLPHFVFTVDTPSTQSCVGRPRSGHDLP